MTSPLLQQFADNHEAFLAGIDAFPEVDFIHSISGKWTPGQHLKHIALVLEKFRKPLPAKDYIREKFGPLSRAAWDEALLLTQYQKTSRKAPENVLPGTVAYAEKEALLAEARTAISGIGADLSAYSEEELDTITLPHPLLGLLTIREWIYLLSFHALLHLEQAQRA